MGGRRIVSSCISYLIAFFQYMMYHGFWQHIRIVSYGDILRSSKFHMLTRLHVCRVIDRGYYGNDGMGGVCAVPFVHVVFNCLVVVFIGLQGSIDFVCRHVLHSLSILWKTIYISNLLQSCYSKLAFYNSKLAFFNSKLAFCYSKLAFYTNNIAHSVWQNTIRADVHTCLNSVISL